jgi:WD40 repeat protein
MSDAYQPDRDPAGTPYYSLAALQAAHNDLLQRSETLSVSELDAVLEFMHAGTATGALLGNQHDRRVAQAILDYWAAKLYRVGAEPPDSTLAEFDPDLAPALPDQLCPYVGLDAFREADSQKFFGRRELISRLIDRLNTHRLIAVVGPSGSGKSSVVRAGLIPALKQGAVPDSQNWIYVPPIVPGSDPVATLDRILRSEKHELITGNEHAILGSAVLDTPHVLVVDQFEELFTLCDDEAARREFVDRLLALTEDQPAPSGDLLPELLGIPRASSPYRVILTMRSDFETFVARLPQLQPHFEAGRIQMTPLSAAELREAIVQPATAVGLTFESGVVEQLLQDILGEPAGLPLLQFTLLKLWEQRDRNRITHAAYEQVGGGRLALARSADSFYSQLIPEEQVTARRILLRMVRPGAGLEITSRRIRREDLHRGGEDPGRVDRVLSKLVAAHLVRLTAGETPGDTQVEVAHEALVRNWPTLVSWLEEEKLAIATRQRFESRAAEWNRLGQGGGLLDEVELREAERWLASSEAAFLGYDELLPKLVAASKAALELLEQEQAAAHRRELAQVRALAEEQRLRAEGQARAVRGLTLLAAALAIAIAAVIWLAIVAFNQRTIAEAQRTTAVEQSQLAATAAAQAQAERDLANQARAQAVASEAHTQELARAGESLSSVESAPDQALLLALAAVPTDTTSYQPLVLRALYRAFDAAPIQRSLGSAGGVVRSAAWRPDGQQLLSGESDGTARIWDVKTGVEVRKLGGHTGGIYAVAWSPNGQQIITAGEDATVRMWEASSGAELRQLAGHTGPVFALAWSPDGRQLASSGDDNTVHIWEAASGAELQRLVGHTDPVFALAWSPDGQHIVTSSDDQTARVWNIATGAETLRLGEHTRVLRSVAWSPDGRYIATGSEDTLIRIWDAVTGERKVTLRGHTGSVLALSWSPDSKNLLSGSGDTTARIWDIIIGSEVQQLRGNASFVYAVAWSPNGQQVLTASQNVLIWDVADPALIGTFTSASSIRAVAWNSDAKRALIGDNAGEARIWNLATEDVLPLSEKHRSSILSAAWSPDGQQVSTASSDATVRIWNAATGARTQTLLGHSEPIFTSAWSPDGQRIATGGADKTLRVWDVATGQETLRLAASTASIWSVAWSPDGRMLMSGGDDRIVHIWNVATGREIQRLSQHTNSIYSVAWSPDGRLLMSAGIDGVARVWDAQTGEQLHILKGHEGVIWSVAWSADARYALTSGADRTIRMWDIATATEIRTIQAHTTGVYSVSWGRDGQLALSGSEDGTASVWLIEPQLIIAAITDRVCTLFTDEKIRTTIDHWRGCPQERASVAANLKVYEDLRHEHRVPSS